jgi:hypothetical protein
LPIWLPPVPCFFPADAWAQRTQRAEDRNCPAAACAAAVVDLVKQDAGPHLADARHGPQPRVGLGISALRGARPVHLQVGELLVVGIDQGARDRDGLLDAGVGEA